MWRHMRRAVQEQAASLLPSGQREGVCPWYWEWMQTPGRAGFAPCL